MSDKPETSASTEPQNQTGLTYADAGVDIDDPFDF